MVTYGVKILGCNSINVSFEYNVIFSDGRPTTGSSIIEALQFDQVMGRHNLIMPLSHSRESGHISTSQYNIFLLDNIHRMSYFAAHKD